MIITGIFFSFAILGLTYAVWQKMKYARLLEAQKHEMKLRNVHLEREIEARLTEITRYNRQLERYAFVTAHNLRAPVARIIGLAHLYDLSRAREEELELKEKLVITVLELDQVVSQLNMLLDAKSEEPVTFHWVETVDKI